MQRLAPRTTAWGDGKRLRREADRGAETHAAHALERKEPRAITQPQEAAVFRLSLCSVHAPLSPLNWVMANSACPT